MNLPGQQSPDTTLPGYDLSRSLGLQAGTDIDFKKLAAQLDCTRNFYNVGIIFDDGKQRWLVRPSRRIADVNQSTVSHVIISKIPDAKEIRLVCSYHDGSGCHFAGCGRNGAARYFRNVQADESGILK